MRAATVRERCPASMRAAPAGTLKDITMAQVMPSRSRMQTAPLLTVLLLLAAMPLVLQAGFVKVWQLQETAAAPVLVVGRVLGVRKVERLPEGSLPWKAETWAMTAEIEVLRSYTNAGEPL